MNITTGTYPPAPVVSALAAALLFGASTPFAKQLTGEMSAVLLAGLLYVGSGVGLSMVRALRDGGGRPSGLSPSDWKWFLAAIAFGGVLGPVLLMAGLSRTTAGSASLLLNLESVLTAVIAWLVFHENADRRIVLGMLLIVAGGVVLSWPATRAASTDWLGPLAIAGACLCWAIDNNLTRKVSASDALYVAGTKGLAAGCVNVGLALGSGAIFPAWQATGQALLVGFLGYGVSLVLFVLALRGLGAARTGAYFSTAPFIGAAFAVGVFNEATGTGFWIAAALMGTGVWLHLTERHEHRHTHEALSHTHSHTHDEHHRHEHAFDWDGREPHAHPHRHEPITHAHPHYPDIHHQHGHTESS